MLSFTLFVIFLWTHALCAVNPINIAVEFGTGQRIQIQNWVEGANFFIQAELPLVSDSFVGIDIRSVVDFSSVELENLREDVFNNLFQSHQRPSNEDLGVFVARANEFVNRNSTMMLLSGDPKINFREFVQSFLFPPIFCWRKVGGFFIKALPPGSNEISKDSIVTYVERLGFLGQKNCMSNESDNSDLMIDLMARKNN